MLQPSFLPDVSRSHFQQAQPSHLACWGGTETSGLPWSPCPAPARCPSPCSWQTGAGGSRDPFSGVLALFFIELHFLSILDQTATSSKSIIAGYFLSDYLMPEQSTGDRKLALEDKSYTIVHPFNTARISERTQLLSLQRRKLLGVHGPPTPPPICRAARAEEQGRRRKTQVSNSFIDFCCPQVILINYHFFFWK